MLSTMNSTYFGGKIFTAFPVVISSLKRQSRTTVAAINKKGGKQQNVKGQRFDVQIGKDTSVPVTLGFTKSNELFVGRLAMIGFASAIIGELLTGKGALAQFGLETGIPITDTEPLVIGLVIFNLVAALLPAKGVFVPSDEEEERKTQRFFVRSFYLHFAASQILWNQRIWIHQSK
eukprot:EC096100.1.p2 GENE.EC096100.1~~EC096100.1.p2  ORF type:complete len:176 (+),score=20.39 EC096100.1:3-530(+)